jgi:hypothetical protein
MLGGMHDSRDCCDTFSIGGFGIRKFGCKEISSNTLNKEQLDPLVDLWLPDGSGLDLPSEVKRRAGKELPFIAVRRQQSFFQEAAQAGFCSCRETGQLRPAIEHGSQTSAVTRE